MCIDMRSYNIGVDAAETTQIKQVLNLALSTGEREWFASCQINGTKW